MSKTSLETIKGEAVRLESRHMNYRELSYIRRDILFVLLERGELNQSLLFSYCGLNHSKHKSVLEGLIEKGMVSMSVEKRGEKSVMKYRIAESGLRFFEQVMLPYERMFPRPEASRFPVEHHLGSSGINDGLAGNF